MKEIHFCWPVLRSTLDREENSCYTASGSLVINNTNIYPQFAKEDIHTDRDHAKQCEEGKRESPGKQGGCFASSLVVLLAVKVQSGHIALGRYPLATWLNSKEYY